MTTLIQTPAANLTEPCAASRVIPVKATQPVPGRSESGHPQRAQVIASTDLRHWLRDSLGAPAVWARRLPQCVM